MLSRVIGSLSEPASIEATSDNDFEEACRRSIAEAELERNFHNSLHDAEFEEACRRSLAECDAGSCSDVSEDTLAAIQACWDEMETVDLPAESFIPPAELQNTANYSLAVVIKALSRTLAGCDGAALLSFSCPFSLDEHAQSIFQEMVAMWLTNFLRIAESMPVDITDDGAKRLLKVALRGIMQLVAIWHRDSDHNEIVNLTKEWIVSLLVNVTGGQVAAEGMDMMRLRSLLSVASCAEVAEGETNHGRPLDYRESMMPLDASNIHDALSHFGCKSDSVAALHENVAFALFRKLHELQDTEEEDIFTCRQLVVNGRVAAGLGVVVRRGSEAGSCHVFVYDLVSLRKWVERSHQDPSTRQPLDVGEIVEIS